MRTNGHITKPLTAELVVLTALLAGSNLVVALPTLIERSLLGGVDSATIAVAALVVGLVTVPLAFAQSIIAFTVTPIAKAAGAGDRRLAVRLAVQNLWLAGILGVGFLALTGAAEFLGGGRDEVLYRRSVWAACLPSVLVTAASAWLTAQRAGAAVLAVNVLFSGLQIAWSVARIPGGGLASAGEARLVAAGGAALLALLFLGVSREFRLGCALRDLLPDCRLLGQVLRGGVANAVSVSLAACVPAGFLMILQRTNFNAAAVGVGLAVYAVAFSGLLGLSQAVQTLTSWRLGEGRPDLLTRSTWIAFLVAIPLAAGTALLLWTTPTMVLRLACGGDRAWQTMAITLHVVFPFLGIHVFGHAAWVTFAAALRSTNQLRFLSATTFVLGVVVLGGAWFAVQVGAELPTLLTLLCLYVTSQATATFLRFARKSSGMVRPLENERAIADFIEASRLKHKGDNIHKIPAQLLATCGAVKQ